MELDISATDTPAAARHRPAEPNAKPTAIAAEKVTKVYGAGTDAVRALESVDVAIRENEFFTLLGPSGCGKTTLLRLIAGFEHPTGGRILLYGQDISPLPPFRRPVNTVFQNYALFPHMTVGGNIAFGLEMLGRPKSEVDSTVSEMLALVRMEELKNRRVSEISGGQQQRVALARALAPRPKVLLLDEPLSALDLKLRKEMQIELKRLQHETGITFVFVTHDQEEALTMSDRLAVMDKGRILQVGSPRDIYERPAQRFVADFIGETNFLAAEIVSVEGSGATVQLASGAMISASLPEGDQPSGKVTVVVRPEHAVLTTDESAASLTGTVDNIVYFGTDTRYHLRLADESEFVIRAQSQRGGETGPKVGERAGAVIGDAVAQILKD
ncbi:MAG TPA: ABC transporter ATP-binding protein [Aestuariivirgaceae bacterium]|nr:ABC transporter ATP-binding protein [Aestuariivirgaceae bacterium]